MLDVIIINYKTSKDVDRCLHSIILNEKKYKEYTYYIVDNNSNDAGLDTLKVKYPFINLIHAEKNGGFAYGNNIAIKCSNSEFILLLNPDTYIEDNSIEKLLQKLYKSHEIAIIGPQLLNADKSNQSFILPKSYLSVWKLFCEEFFLHRIFRYSKTFNSYFRTYMDYQSETIVEQVSGAAFMFRRNIIDSIGLMDENYFMFFEESDFCLQAIRNGFTLFYYPESKIIHALGVTAEGISETRAQYFISSFKYYFKKNFSFPSLWSAVFLLSLGSMIRAMGLFITGKKRYKNYIYYLKYLLFR